MLRIAHSFKRVMAFYHINKATHMIITPNPSPSFSLISERPLVARMANDSFYTFIYFKHQLNM